jgi:hypothetical protein
MDSLGRHKLLVLVIVLIVVLLILPAIVTVSAK